MFKDNVLSTLFCRYVVGYLPCRVYFLATFRMALLDDSDVRWCHLQKDKMKCCETKLQCVCVNPLRNIYFYNENVK